MRRLLKALPLALPLMLALAAVGLFLTSCNSGSQAQARFIDALAAFDTQIDVYFNGTVNSGTITGTKYFSSVIFPDVRPSSGYTAVPAGSDTIQAFQAGSTTIEEFQNENVGLNAGTSYTMVATGTVPGGSGSVTVLNPTDNNTEPTDGLVSFRVIDAAISGPSSVSVYILSNPAQGLPTCCTGETPTVTVSGPLSGSGATSGYVNQSFNSLGTGFTGYVTVAGGGTPIFSFPIANFGDATEGSIRTIVLTDNSTQTGFDTVPIILIDLN
jgi:hypothetical protein